MAEALERLAAVEQQCVRWRESRTRDGRHRKPWRTRHERKHFTTGKHLSTFAPALVDAWASSCIAGSCGAPTIVLCFAPSYTSGWRRQQPMTLIINSGEQEGFLAWRRLLEHYEPPQRTRFAGQLLSLLSWDFWDINDVENQHVQLLGVLKQEVLNILRAQANVGAVPIQLDALRIGGGTAAKEVRKAARGQQPQRQPDGVSKVQCCKCKGFCHIAKAAKHCPTRSLNGA
eukprot:1315104-Amphidinium_carterae.1